MVPSDKMRRHLNLCMYSVQYTPLLYARQPSTTDAMIHAAPRAALFASAITFLSYGISPCERDTDAITVALCSAAALRAFATCLATGIHHHRRLSPVPQPYSPQRVLTYNHQ